MALVRLIHSRSGAAARDRARRLVDWSTLRLVGLRLLSAVVVLCGVTFVTYAVTNMLRYRPRNYGGGLLATKAEMAAINNNHKGGPFWAGYGHWLDGVLHGNLGTDYLLGTSVNSQLARYLPVTLGLVAYALAVSLLLALMVAAFAAWRPNGIADRFSRVLSRVGRPAVPYVFAIVVILVFGLKLGWFPVRSALQSGNAGVMPLGSTPWSWLWAMTLPAASLGFPLFATYTRLLRSGLVEHMQREDYIVRTRAKRVVPQGVLFRHALRNSMVTLAVIAGRNLGKLIGGAVIIEAIFTVPGVGSHLLGAIGDNDVPLMAGIVLVLALLTVLGNLLADLLCTVLGANGYQSLAGNGYPGRDFATTGCGSTSPV